MKTSDFFRSLTALPFFALCITAMFNGRAFGKDPDDSKEKSLLRVAAAPARPDSKKYELRYKLDRGDVIRYEVTHRASIHTTIEKTTEEAQTQTDSVKAWKV